MKSSLYSKTLTCINDKIADAPACRVYGNDECDDIVFRSFRWLSIQSMTLSVHSLSIPFAVHVVNASMHPSCRPTHRHSHHSQVIGAKPNGRYVWAVVFVKR